MSRILVTTPIPAPGMDILERAGQVDVRRLDYDGLRRASASGDYSVIVSQLRDRFDAPLLRDSSLVGISNYAVGFDNIDVAAATAAGITVANTPGVLTDSTADVAMLLMLATARRGVESDRFLRAGSFTGWEPELLLGSDVSRSHTRTGRFRAHRPSDSPACACIRHDRDVLSPSTRGSRRVRRRTRRVCGPGAACFVE